MKAHARLIALAGMLVFGAAPAVADPGRDLYEGRVPLAAHLRGETTRLPATATRCANCHEPAAAAPLQAPLGPRLEASTLTRAVARHGGPPSRHDLASFCRALREGVDPALVLLSRAMPVFLIDDTDCRALWEYLSARGQQDGSSP